MNILMLGWELPPKISGGLGRACDGLLKGLARQPGLRTTFAIPSFSGHNFSTLTESVTILPISSTKECRVDAANFRNGHSAQGGRFGSYDGLTLEHDTQNFADGLVNALPALPSFDVIHAHDWLTFEAGIQLKSRTGKKLVAHVHSIEYDRQGAQRGYSAIHAIEKRGLDRADGIIAVSYYSKTIIAREYDQHPDRIKVIHNAISPRMINKPLLDDNSERRFIDDKKLVTFLGRLTHQKGPELFLEAAYLIWQQMPDVRFVMAGDGDLMPLLKSLTRVFGMEDAISFPGFLDDRGVRALLSSSNLLIMPSVSEPFGLVALEAVQAGVPVILSTQCGVAEVISSAISICPDDIHALADWGIRILQDKALAQRLVNTARIEASKLSWDEAAIMLQRMYVDLMNNPAPV